MLQLIWLHLLLVLGGLMGGVGLFLLIRDPRRRTHTLIWVIVIVLAPYVGVPLYLLLGNKRVKKTIKAKGLMRLSDHSQDAESEAIHGVGQSIEALLSGMRMPPLTSGNNWEMLPDGVAAWNRLRQLAESAQQSIEMETYVFKMDATGKAMRDLLIQKAREGVAVRVLIDSLGSHATRSRFFTPLVEAGGEVEWFIPLLHGPRRGSSDTRNHRKIALFDRRHVLAGGSNIGEEYIGPTQVPDRWVDINFHLEGPAVRHYMDIFRSDWEFATRSRLSPSPEVVVERRGDTLAQVIPSGVDVPEDVLYNAVITAVYEARHRLWVTTPYFVPDEPLMHALALAARRGIDMRIILPDVSNQKLADIGRGPVVREIARWGGRIIRYTGGMFHAKTIVVDDSWALVGSMNTDRRSLFLNFEVMLALYQREHVEAIAEWNERLMSPSTEGPRVANRGRRIWEGLVRLVASEL